MRTLALHLAFEGLDAREATSGAFADNAPSNGVSKRVGYEFDGSFRVAREGEAVLHHRYTMSRERWESLRPVHASLLAATPELAGVEGLRAMIDVAALP